MTALNQDALNTLFFNARTHNVWLDKEVPDSLLKQLFDTLKWAPTSANCSPIRLVFVKSKEAKEKLKPCLAEGNVEKTMTAPVTAIVALDTEFYEQMPKLFPHTDARSWFVGNQSLIDFTSNLNTALQGGYLILAARALGLDCGPMSGFDRAKTDEAFFSGTNYKSLFLVNLGYGDASKLHPRSPRFDFDDAAKIL
jgi:3-hydroxypropanoate dehydrogenase